MDSKMNAADFKARCLSVLDEVASSRRPVTVTKRGKPVARLVPLEPDAGSVNPLKGSVIHELDLAAPAHEVWGESA